MVAPLIAPAGIAAAGSLLGGITGGKGAKKAAKIQQQTTREQIAANNANRDFLTNLSQPNLDRGNWAGGIYAGLLGQGDATAAREAQETWRGSTGYQDLLKTGLDSINANAYARGLGDSGATMKALQAKGMALADQNQQTYLANLGNLIQTGNSAIGNIAGVATQATQANSGALQAGADASSNAALASSGAWQQALRNLTNIGMGAVTPGATMGSSYGGGSGFWGGPNGNWPGQAGLPTFQIPGGGYAYGGYGGRA